jgi:arylsulfatase A-like enzyme
MMKKLKWLVGAVAACLLPQSLTAAPVAEKPNIIFILADDMGWGDLSCYGHSELQTPNLDRLAGQGKLFTQFYVNSGVCSPSRVAFTTGQFPARHGVHGHFSSVEENEEREMPNWLDPAVPTLAKQLKAQGYATAHFGKWHMTTTDADAPAPEPTEYGFDKALGYLSSGPQLLGNSKKTDPYFRAKTTKAIVDETIQFIEENKGKPFYINAWTLIPHTCLNPTPEQMAPFMEKFAPRLEGHPHAGARVVYYSTIADFDTQVGRLMDKLDEMGIADNTIVILTSDNGPEDIMLTGNSSSHSGIGSTGPFRGRKRSLYEGGIRVPLIIRWPGHVEAGSIDDDSVVAAADFMPTLCKLAGAEVPVGNYAPDGEDVGDIIMNGSRARKEPLMWEYHYEMTFGHIIHKNPIMAIRDGDWKLLMNPDGKRVELYNIPEDSTELNNVAEDHPAMVELLSEKLLQWHHDLPRAPIPEKAGSNDYPWPGRS